MLWRKCSGNLRWEILDHALHEMKSFVVVTLRGYQFLEDPQETTLQKMLSLNIIIFLYIYSKGIFDINMTHKHTNLSWLTICGAACVANALSSLTSGLILAGLSHKTGANKQGNSCMYGSGTDPGGVFSIRRESIWKTYGINSENNRV